MIDFLSAFSGIGGFDLGFERAGMNCVAQIENDAFCQKVLRKHWPNVQLEGDVKDVKGKDFNSRPAVFCFGSPCQDLSIAGRRKGLEGERSGLFYEAARLIKECKPAIAVWENVPGARTSNDGLDFYTVLRTFRQLGARDIAWRSVDSRYFGVAQRRERVYLVADFAGERAAQILFESPQSNGHPATRSRTRPGVGSPAGGGVARSVTAASSNPDLSSGKGTAIVYAPDVAYAVADATGNRTGSGRDAQDTFVVLADGAQNDRIASSRSQSRAIDAHHHQQPFVFDERQLTSPDNWSNPQPGDPSHPLHTGQPPFVVFGGEAQQTDLVYRDEAPALRKGDVPLITFDANGYGGDSNDQLSPTLQAAGHDESHANGGRHVGIYDGVQIRRLTPIECERVQGFPDKWTCTCDDPQLFCKCPDGPRYKALGNACTVSVTHWIGLRIMEALNVTAN